MNSWDPCLRRGLAELVLLSSGLLGSSKMHVRVWQRDGGLGLQNRREVGGKQR